MEQFVARVFGGGRVNIGFAVGGKRLIGRFKKGTAEWWVMFLVLCLSGHRIQGIISSAISDFKFNSARISFDVAGGNGATGFCGMCIPRVLMDETYRVFMNGTEVSCSLLSISNSTHSYLYFTYGHSTQKVIVIPEFPSFLILPLFMMATLLAVIVYRRKHTM